MAPVVTAVIPTYNRARTLPRSIGSVLTQTYPRVELIVVDDGSTDDTSSVLERYAGRLRVVRQANAGPSAARNSGLRESAGDIVAFLDSDDEWVPEKIERQVQLMTRVGPAAVCCVCDATMKYPGGREVRAFDESALAPASSQSVWLNVLPILATRFLLFNQTAAIWKEPLVSCGGFDENLWLLEDYDLALRLSQFGPWCVISDSLVIWHGGADNSLSDRATNDSTRLNASLETILTRCLEAPWCSDPRARFFLRARREISRIEFWTSRLQSRPSVRAGRATVSLARALLRRLPWYPEMLVRAVGAE